MRSPLTALAWEMWRRGRRSAWGVLGSTSICALINLGILDKVQTTETGHASSSVLFGLLMTLSFLFLMGIFNYTEFNSTKEWNGFPYRLFALPVPTWQLVALPMFLCVISVELVYFAWIKLVWTHQRVVMPEWFAVLLGAYAIFYQMTLWTFAGLRITRVIVLGLGGAIGIGVACLPLFAENDLSPWLSENRLIPVVIGMAFIAFVTAWGAVARQRCGGGRRWSWMVALLDRLIDTLPRRSRDFASPAAAQFWFEWRRTGWLLPVCTAFVLMS